jgi:hypothetical protein
MIFGISIFASCALLAACGGDDAETTSPTTKSPPACDVMAQTGCAEGLACEAVQGKDSACFAPLTLKGRVFDSVSANHDGIAGARVVARDANDAAVSTVAISAADGTYSLAVPAPRDAEGVPLQQQYTLRADASGYDTFPRAPRIAIPIELSTATGDPPAIQSAATDIGLIPLPDVATLGSVSGKIVGDVSDVNGDPLRPGGALIVAGSATAIADREGSFVVFNVPAGEVEVQGYAQGLEIAPESVSVVADKETPNVELELTGEATATISGAVQIVNPGAGTATSVILVLENTFNANAARGEAPRGLRAGNVTGAWSIAGVPNGRYVVLAAFENDDLVRDPDTSIGGTQLVHITVAGGANQDLADSFKVTGALAVKSPGASTIDEVSGTPEFEWEDDSSEDKYQLQVFDALGNLTWEDLSVPGVSGAQTVKRSYGGPALVPGMIYQFRATSLKKGVPLSSTEDLKGVFLYK